MLLSTLFALAFGAGAFQDTTTSTPSAVVLRTPDVSNDTIVFRFASDLWLVPREGGVARRITSAPGVEAFPRFSPDGSRLAFVASYEGGQDLYVMPTAGGVPQRVTYHPTSEVLCDWTPDGEHLLYHASDIAGLARAPRLSKVHVSGGQPVPLPPPYGTFGAIDATGQWLAYTPSTVEFRTWKRYQGGLAQDIWLFDLSNGAARRVTEHLGADAQPMWNGRELLFVSDRGPEGILNLHALDIDANDGAGAVTQLTFFDEFGVRFASIGPRDVVFENGGRLYRFDLEQRALVAVDVSIPGDLPYLAPEEISVAGNIASADAGPTAKRVVFEARGELFTAPAKDGFTRQLTATSGVAERGPAWSPDGVWIAYFSDRTGEYELTLRRADGATFEGANEHGERSVSTFGPGFRAGIVWAPDSKKLTFTDNAGNLWLARSTDFGKGEVTIDKIAQNPAGFPMSAVWSPKSDWLAWSHRHPVAFTNAIHLFELATRTTTCVTSGAFDDDSPTFAPSGDFLYFLSSRYFSPTYADLDTTWIYAGTRVVLAVPLRSDVVSPLAPKNDDEEPLVEEEEATEEAAPVTEEAVEELSDATEKTLEETSGDVEEALQETSDAIEEAISQVAEEIVVALDDVTEEAAVVEEEGDGLVIELEGFEARAFQLPIAPGGLSALTATSKGLVYMRSTPRGSDDERGGTKIVLADLEKFEESVVLTAGGYSVCARADKLFVTAGDAFGFVDIAADQTLTPIDTSGLVALVDPRAEWRQMLIDTWRIFRDWFYDERMHGLDWPAVRERYLTALEHATTREDLAFLCGEMMSELNVGHAYNGASTPSGPAAKPDRAAGLLGADFEVRDGRLVVANLVRGGDYDTDARGPLAHTKVAVGHALVAVDGRPVDASRAVHAALLGTAGRTTQLSFLADPADEASRYDVLVEPVASDTALRYRDWVRKNRERVTELSQGRIAYVHVPDTGVNGQNELVRQMAGALHAPALLVDERWNGGGQIPTRFVELLDRPLVNKWAVRHGEDWQWPPDGHRGPKAMLINGWAGSGGDAFPYYFRQKGLGKLFGRRTWGGLVGISGNPSLVDGTSHSVPTFGFYELDGTWGIEGHGVDPDVDVIDDPAALARGEDPQLEAAVAHLLAELERNPPTQPARPAAPDRSGTGVADQDK
jgi:tricorn protease